MGGAAGDKMQWNGSDNRTQDLGDAQLRPLPGDGANWRVFITGSRASQNWENGVEGPNACERTYTLASATESTNLKPFADSFSS
jgi:hypothetical protein